MSRGKIRAREGWEGQQTTRTAKEAALQGDFILVFSKATAVSLPQRNVRLAKCPLPPRLTILAHCILPPDLQTGPSIDGPIIEFASHWPIGRLGFNGQVPAAALAVSHPRLCLSLTGRWCHRLCLGTKSPCCFELLFYGCECCSLWIFVELDGSYNRILALANITSDPILLFPSLARADDTGANVWTCWIL